MKLELVDILIYMIRLADKLDIDLASATHYKFAVSSRKYPVDKVKRDARKYTEYGVKGSQ